MNLRIATTLAASTLAALALFACPATECADGEQRCDGEMIQTCEEGAWGAAEACEGTMNCMAMDSGVEHCMEAM